MQLHPEIDLERLFFNEITFDINKVRASLFPSIKFKYATNEVCFAVGYYYDDFII